MQKEILIKQLNEINFDNYPGITFEIPKIIYKENEYDDELNINQTNYDDVKTELNNHSDNFNFIDNIKMYLDDIFSVTKDVVIHKIEFLNIDDTNYKLIIYSDKELNTMYLNNKIKLDNYDYHIQLITENEQNVFDTTESVLQKQQNIFNDTVSVSKLLHSYINQINNIDSLINLSKERLIKKIKNTTFYNKEFKNRDVYIGFFGSSNEINISFNSYTLAFKSDDNGNIIPTSKFNSDNINFYKEIKNELTSLFKLYSDNDKNKNGLCIQIPVINADFVVVLNGAQLIVRFLINADSYDNNNKFLEISYVADNPTKFVYSFTNNKLFQLLLIDDGLKKLYDNAFVKIEDCPEFLKEKLRKKDTAFSTVSQNITSELIDKCSNSDSKNAKKIKSLLLKRF